MVAQIKLGADEEVVVVATTFEKGVIADFYLEASASSLPVREERPASRNREERARACVCVCVYVVCVRECVCVFVSTRACVCVRERESVCGWGRDCRFLLGSFRVVPPSA